MRRRVVDRIDRLKDDDDDDKFEAVESSVRSMALELLLEDDGASLWGCGTSGRREVVLVVTVGSALSMTLVDFASELDCDFFS